jgi:hypothetical protein
MTFHRLSLSFSATAFIGFAVAIAIAAPSFGAYSLAMLVGAVLFGVAGAITLGALVTLVREEESRR